MLRVLCLIRHPSCIRYTVTHLPESYNARPGASGASRVLNVSLPACHGLRTPVDLHILAKTDASVLPSESVKTLGVHNNPFRSCTSTSGYTVTPTAYRILCLRLAHLVRRYNHRLRHRPKTRYGWLAKPCPAETFTLQDTPNLTRRDNVGAHGRRVAA